MAHLRPTSHDAPLPLQSPMLDSRISLQKLHVLCLVVEFGTVTKAAEHLFVAQPVVTAHLQSLEERLGVTLFVRRGRKLELTEAGERVHSWSVATMTRVHAMMDELQGLRDGERGTALIGASMSLGTYRLPAVLARLRADHPDIELSLSTSDPETALRGVEQGQLDFCVVVLDHPPSGAVLEAERLGEEDIVLVTADGGPPLGAEIALAELADVPIVGSPGGSVRKSLVDGALARFDAPAYRTVIEFGHPEAMKCAVAAGLGATLLFRSAVELELTSGALREVRISDAELSVPIFSVMRRDKHLSKLQRRLLEVIGDELSRGDAPGLALASARLAS